MSVLGYNALTARLFGSRSASQFRAISINATLRKSNQETEQEIKFKFVGPYLKDFVKSRTKQEKDFSIEQSAIPYLCKDSASGRGKRVYFETYGCQMNVSDTEIAWAILQKNGYLKTANPNEADVVMLMTCAIRENAEHKVWQRISQLRKLKHARHLSQPPVKIALLGCMAERLKKKVLEKTKLVDVIAGPDSYKDLPRLLSESRSGQTAINVMLSVDETYADIVPVRLDPASKSAYVSIMRGCDNMCSYCIVPFTRGRERSRPIKSIVEEVKILSEKGIKEVTLLGQNVNSYRDISEETYYGLGGAISNSELETARGFKTIYKAKKGGLRFASLLEQVAAVDPEMRIRFTSPHPKDFPDEVLEIVRETKNISKQIHLPAQSGNSAVLQRMRRGYTREAYLELVEHIRGLIPEVALTSDFIAGFCDESDVEHEDTLSLLKIVKYNYAFLFAYSMRQKTHAYHRMKDNVPENVKQQRLQDLISVAREGMLDVNRGYIGTTQLVLVEGRSKRSPSDMAGRTDGGTKVIIPNIEIPSQVAASEDTKIGKGDYVAVHICDANSQVLKGIPLYHTTLSNFSNDKESYRATSYV